MRSFVKIKSSRNGEITLWFTDAGKLCPSQESLTRQIYLFTLYLKINSFGNTQVKISKLRFTSKKIVLYLQIMSEDPDEMLCYARTCDVGFDSLRPINNLSVM